MAGLSPFFVSFVRAFTPPPVTHRKMALWAGVTGFAWDSRKRSRCDQPSRCWYFVTCIDS